MTLFIVFIDFWGLFLSLFVSKIERFTRFPQKSPTCVSTAPWRVDWGSDLSKFIQKLSNIDSKSVLKTRPSKKVQTIDFLSILESQNGPKMLNFGLFFWTKKKTFFFGWTCGKQTSLFPPIAKARRPEWPMVLSLSLIKNASGLKARRINILTNKLINIY